MQKSDKIELSKKLEEIRDRFDHRTYASYVRKINNSEIKLNDLKLIKAIPKKFKKLTNTLIKKNIKTPKNIKKIPKNNHQPKFIKQTLLDKFKFYTKYNFNYINIKTNKQFYNAITDALGRFKPATTVSIHIRNKESRNKVRSISLTRNDLVTYDEFEEALRVIVQGEFPGSDPIDESEDEIIYNNFALTSSLIAGNGKISDKMLFKVVGVEETTRKIRGKDIGNNDCGFECLKKLIDVNSMTDLLNKKSCEFRNIDNIISFIRLKNLHINVMSNSFLLKRDHNEIVNDGEMLRKVIKDKKGVNRKYVCSKLDIDKDIEIVYFHKDDDAKSTIIYDEFNQHYDIILDNKLNMCDNIYLTLCCRVIKDDEILFSAKQININNKKTIKNELKYLFFDYETVIDFKRSNCMKEYSLSILNLNNTELVKLTRADEEKDEKTVKEIRNKCCITFLGYDCTVKFIEWILCNQIDISYILIGFNNANFDNFLLLDGLLRYKKDNIEFSVNDIFYNGSQLLNFYICGRHNTFDIRKHLMGSLKNNCESFKINCCSKKSFDHNISQQLYVNGKDKLIEYITDNDELKEYNEYDVLATAVLFCKYRSALNNIDATKYYAPMLHNIKTIGSLIYKVFVDSKLNKRIELPKLKYEHYKDLQKCKIAGRVEMFNGIQKVEERIVSTDVCSLYPYIMSVSPVYYPCGEIIECDEYQGDDVIGFYYCDIDQSNLRGENLPKIYAKKTKIENDWGHEEILENYLISNVMIGSLKKYKCKVIIKKGFYFTDKKKSCDIFDFLLDFMKAKNEQDLKKKNKDEDYNSALRETLKLLMNSLSGKVIEGLHTEKTEDVNSVAEYEKIKSKSNSINLINSIGNKIFVTYKVDEKTLLGKQRPVYLGILIYDYAKRYMYDYSYSKIGLDNLLYTDTDASKFRYKNFLTWKKWIDENNIRVPHWPEVELIDERYKYNKIYESDSKVFGSFEDEVEDMIGDKYVFYCLEKKSWCYSADAQVKFRFKGLNPSSLLLSLDENFIQEKTIKHKQNGENPAWNEVKYQIEGNNELEVYNFAQQNKKLSIDNGNEIKFFESIYSTGEAYLLCCSFRKIVKNSAHNVVLGNNLKYNNLMNKVQVNYMMKHINLYKK